jgi:hypothetical protein
VRVRVLDAPFARGLARAVATFAAAALLAILIDDYTGLDLVPIAPTPWGYTLVTVLLLVISPLAPWLVRPAHPRVAELAVRDGVVYAGRLAIRAGEVTALRIVEGARGFSVALARGRRLTFLELERARDAAVVVSALGDHSASIDFPRASWFMRIVRIVSSALVALSGVVYAGEVAAFWWLPGHKTLPGFLGVVFAQVVLVVTAIATRRDFAKTPFGDHVLLHASSPHVVPESEDRRDFVARGDEPVAAWFARLDAVPVGSSVYRDAAAREKLWELVADGHAPVDARIGAARVLRRSHGEARDEIVRVVSDDDDVRLRVEAATDDDGACEKIERLGPLFRYPARP